MRPVLLLAALPLLGCGGAAGLILKDPIVDKCTSAGIQGCPDLADGVLLFIDEKFDEGREKIATGAAANSPEQLREFAVVLKQIGNIPGADRYMGPVLEVARVIAGKADERGGPPKKKVKPKPPAEDGAVAEAAAPSAPMGSPAVVVPPIHIPNHWMTADADPFQVDGSTAAPALSPSRVACDAPFGLGTAWCVTAIKGPFFLTDIWGGPACQADLFAAAGGSEARSWSLSPLTMHGGRLFVRSGESLVLGAHGKGAAEQKCAITWAGFRPYTGTGGDL